MTCRPPLNTVARFPDRASSSPAETDLWKAIIPTTDDLGRILEGVVLDIKTIPPVLLRKLEVCYDDGEVTEITSEQIPDIVSQVEQDGSILALDIELDLDLLAGAVEEASSRISSVFKRAVAPKSPE